MEKKIKNFEDYTITEDARVISYKFKKPREIAQWVGSNGRYKYVTLSMHNKQYNLLVHRLVAMAFVEGHEEGLVVHHIDGDTFKNEYTNLEWRTQQENIHESYSKMSQVRNKRKTQLYYNGEFIKEFESVKAAIRFAAKEYNVSPSSLEKYKHSGNCEIRKV